MCTIAILEKYALFGSGIEAALADTKEFKVIGLGPNIESLVMRLNNKNPHIILIDMLHFKNAGVEVIKKVKKIFPRVPLLLITSQEFSDCFKDYRRYGAMGFVFADDSHQDLVHAIRELLSGKEFFRKGVKKEFNAVRPVTKTFTGKPPKENLLTDREISVLKLFCDGLTYKEIGLKLFISPRTVETHKENILAKLNVQTRAEMIKYATLNKFTTS